MDESTLEDMVSQSLELDMNPVRAEDDAVALQGFFLVDRAGTVRHSLVNDRLPGPALRRRLRTRS